MVQDLHFQDSLSRGKKIIWSSLFSKTNFKYPPLTLTHMNRKIWQKIKIISSFSLGLEMSELSNHPLSNKKKSDEMTKATLPPCVLLEPQVHSPAKRQKTKLVATTQVSSFNCHQQHRSSLPWMCKQTTQWNTRFGHSHETWSHPPPPTLDLTLCVFCPNQPHIPLRGFCLSDSTLGAALLHFPRPHGPHPWSPRVTSTAKMEALSSTRKRVSVRCIVRFKWYRGGNAELTPKLRLMLTLSPFGMLSLIMSISLISSQILYGGNANVVRAFLGKLLLEMLLKKLIQTGSYSHSSWKKQSAFTLYLWWLS